MPPAPGYPYGGYPPPPPPQRKTSTGLEIGFLYGTAAAWGAGVGMWIDAEANLCNREGKSGCDPGLVPIAPVVFGVAAPVSVFLVDRFAFKHGMPEGLPSAIAAGMWIGAGEGLGAVSYQMVTAENPWGFKALARGSFIGSTLGGVAGAGLYYALKPVPETNMLLMSSIIWGTAIGAAFGGGATPTFNKTCVNDLSATATNDDRLACKNKWDRINDDVWLAGEIGYNVALAGAVTASIWWTPSWNQLGWMWGGFGLGTVISLPVYIFYAATGPIRYDDQGNEKGYEARHGLIFQGIAASGGLILGAVLAKPRPRGGYAKDEPPPWAKVDKNHPISVVGASLMPVLGGAGVSATGLLW